MSNDDAQARRVREIRDRVESYPENRDPSCLNCDTHVLLARVDALTTQRDALQQRVASLEGWAEAANAWAVHALGIAIDRRIPSADMIRDGQAIVEGLRAALAAAGTVETTSDE